jgi:uncharacterized membrane protein
VPIAKDGILKLFFLYLMSLAYILAGVNHFRAPKMYLPMMPPFLPAPALLVSLSGAAEIILGVLLLWEPARVLAAWGIIALLIAVFPANIYMYVLRETTCRSIPDWVLLGRLPLQLLLIAWAYAYTSPIKV